MVLFNGVFNCGFLNKRLPDINLVVEIADQEFDFYGSLDVRIKDGLGISSFLKIELHDGVKDLVVVVDNHHVDGLQVVGSFKVNAVAVIHVAVLHFPNQHFFV